MEENIAQLPFHEFIVKCAQQLHESLQNNQNMRMKYATQSEKFFPSEQSINSLLNLFQEKLQETQQSAGTVLKLMFSSKILILLLKTLQHPNADINGACINTFYSLIIEMNKQIQETQQNEQEQVFPLFFRMCIMLIENGLIQNMYTTLNKLNEQVIDEYEVVKKIFKIYQTLMEITDKVYPILLKETKLVSFLANRILPNFTVPHKTMDDNKFIASDLLIILLQTPQPDQQTLSGVRQLYQSYGIQVLIQTISYYQKTLPTLNDQREYLSNLFDCLNALLVSVKESRLQFHQMKGIYLMISYICTKTEYAIGALKSITNALQCSENGQIRKNICQDLANDGGLKYLFPMLMRQGIKGKDIDEQMQLDENILNIFYFLVKFSESTTRDRMHNKFTQKRFAKLQRLFELRTQYWVQGENSASMQISAQQYLKMIKDDNLGIIEVIDKIIVSLFEANTSTQMKDKIQNLMMLYKVDIKSIQVVIQRNYKFIDEGNQKSHIEKLLNQNLRLMMHPNSNKQ